MRTLKNDRRDYRCRETLGVADAQKTKELVEKKAEFEFWREGHYSRRREKQ